MRTGVNTRSHASVANVWSNSSFLALVALFGVSSLFSLGGGRLGRFGALFGSSLCLSCCVCSPFSGLWCLCPRSCLFGALFCLFGSARVVSGSLWVSLWSSFGGVCGWFVETEVSRGHMRLGTLRSGRNASSLGALVGVSGWVWGSFLALFLSLGGSWGSFCVSCGGRVLFLFVFFVSFCRLLLSLVAKMPQLRALYFPDLFLS